MHSQSGGGEGRKSGNHFQGCSGCHLIDLAQTIGAEGNSSFFGGVSPTERCRKNLRPIFYTANPVRYIMDYQLSLMTLDNSQLWYVQ